MIYDELNNLENEDTEYFDGISPLSYVVFDCAR